MYLGSFWFLNVENRWKNLVFDLGFVFYLLSDIYIGNYVFLIGGVVVYILLSGFSFVKEVLVF